MNYQVKVEPQEKKKSTRKKVPPWTKKQSALYLRFISGNRIMFESKQMDKCVFQTMRKFIGSENKGAVECYNYHTRMKTKYKTIENIIKGLQEEHGLTQEEIKTEELKMKELKLTMFNDAQNSIKAWFLSLKRPEQPEQEFSPETKVIKTSLNLKFRI